MFSCYHLNAGLPNDRNEQGKVGHRIQKKLHTDNNFVLTFCFASAKGNVLIDAEVGFPPCSLTSRCGRVRDVSVLPTYHILKDKIPAIRRH